MNLPLFINWLHRRQTDKTITGVKVQVMYRGKLHYENEFHVMGGDSIVLKVDDLVDAICTKGEA